MCDAVAVEHECVNLLAVGDDLHAVRPQLLAVALGRCRVAFGMAVRETDKLNASIAQLMLASGKLARLDHEGIVVHRLVWQWHDTFDMNGVADDVAAEHRRELTRSLLPSCRYQL